MTIRLLVPATDQRPPRRRRRGEAFDLRAVPAATRDFLREYRTHLKSVSTAFHQERSAVYRYVSFLRGRPCRADLAAATPEDWEAYLASLDADPYRPQYRSWKYYWRLFEAAIAAGLRSAGSGIPVRVVEAPPLPVVMQKSRIAAPLLSVYERFVVVQDRLVKLRIDKEGLVGVSPDSAANKLSAVRHYLADASDRLRALEVPDAEISVERVLSDFESMAMWLNERPSYRPGAEEDLSGSTREITYHHLRGFLRWAERVKIVPVGAVDALELACTPEGETRAVLNGVEGDDEQEGLSVDQVSDLLTSLLTEIEEAEKAWDPVTRAGAKRCFYAWRAYGLVVTCIAGCCRPETLATMSLDRIVAFGRAYVVEDCAFKARRRKRWDRQYLCTDAYAAIERMRFYRGKTMQHLDEPILYRYGDKYGGTPIAKKRVVHHVWTDFDGRPMKTAAVSRQLRRSLLAAGIEAQPRRLRATGAGLYLNVYGRSPREVAQIGKWHDYRVLFKHYAKRNEMEVYAACEADMGNLLGTTRPAEVALVREACREMIGILDLYAGGIVGLERTADLVRALLLLIEKLASTQPNFLPLAEWIVVPRQAALAASRRLARETDGRLTLSDLLGMPLRTGLPLPGHATRKIDRPAETSIVA
jgi:hypothetical protein